MSLGSVLRGLALGVAVLAPLASGCADTYGKGNAPPKGALYYPTSVVTLPPLAAAPEHRYALVLSSNFDIRFSAGWMSLVDLDALATAQKPADAVVEQVRLPDFGGPIAIDTSGQLAEGETRFAVVGHRGVSELAIVEVTVSGGAPHLSCGNHEAIADLDAAERRTDCDRAHLFSMIDEHLRPLKYARDPDTSVLDLGRDPSSAPNLSPDNHYGFDAAVDLLDFVDPFGTAMYTDPSDGSQHLVVSFLGHGANSVSASVITFVVDPTQRFGAYLVPEHAVVSGRSGLGTMAVQPHTGCDPAVSGSCAVRIAIANRTYGFIDGSSVALLTINDGAARVSINAISAEVSGTELSGVAFTPSGERAYLLSNSPDDLVSVDTTPFIYRPAGGTATEELNFGVLGVVPTAGRPSGLVYLSRADEDLIALTRFTDDTIMLVAVPGAALVPVTELRDVGSGPYSIDSLRDPGGDDLLLVGTFYDHGLTLVRVPQGDVSAASIVARVRSSELGDASKQ